MNTIRLYELRENRRVYFLSKLFIHLHTLLDRFKLFEREIYGTRTCRYLSIDCFNETYNRLFLYYCCKIFRHINIFSILIRLIETSKKLKN